MVKEHRVFEYYYHCTKNALDVLLAGELKARGNALGLGRAVSFYKTKNKNLTAGDGKIYYRRSDDNSIPRLGGICPIHCSFVWNDDMETDKKGSEEYLYLHDLAIDSGEQPGNSNFLGIYVPVRDRSQATAMESYFRLLAVLHTLNMKWVRVSFGDNSGFFNAFTKFYLVNGEANETLRNLLEAPLRDGSYKEKTAWATDLAGVLNSENLNAVIPEEHAAGVDREMQRLVSGS